MLKMLILAIALMGFLVTPGSAVTGDEPYKVLQFGTSASDYILFTPDMTPFQNALTVCAWIRRRQSGNYHTWFSYSTSSSGKEIEITDNGYYAYMFGSGYNLQSKYTISSGAWFHNCLSWDTSSNTFKIYINGGLVYSTSTTSRSLYTGGTMLFGNEQDSPGSGMDTSYDFGGEMYQLNVYDKKLDGAEIAKLASDKCFDVEEFNEVRRIRWEDIVKLSRTGIVMESSIQEECSLKEALFNTTIKLNRTETQLNTTETQLLSSLKEIQALNETIATLKEQIKCPLNETVTSYWDLLYSGDFFEGEITTEKLQIFQKTQEKLEYFKGTRITKGIINFFKVFHDGPRQCN